MACQNNFTTEADFNPEPGFTDYPPYLCPPDNLLGYSDIAERVMDRMLITQYTNSDNLKEYMLAFLEEVNTIMEELHKMHIGRFIANATGAQLDVIGIILQQSRNLNVPKVWFGFQGASPVDGMADEITPADGGVFRSEYEQGYTVTPLNDEVYRKVLLCRGYILNQNIFSVNTVYNAIEILLGRIPAYIELLEVGYRDWQLKLDSTTTSADEQGILLALKHWFIPMEITFNIILV